jgi:hypothetical protein
MSNTKKRFSRRKIKYNRKSAIVKGGDYWDEQEKRRKREEWQKEKEEELKKIRHGKIWRR